VYLVRHGRATGGWDDEIDPALDEVGVAQAEALVSRLGDIGPLPIVTSPMLRTQLTARPLAEHWGVTPTVAPDVTEIPSPLGVPFGQRVPWLRAASAGTWSELGQRYTDYRDQVAAFVASLRTDTVVVSHYIAINAVLGKVIGDDRVVIASLDNCSVTVLEVTGLEVTGQADGGARVDVIEIGGQADTLFR
jgi:broad specificity phosphatase PhoE